MPDHTSLRFQCHGCQTWLKVPAVWADSKRTCPRCQTTYLVPSGEATTTTPDPTDTDDPYEVEAPIQAPSVEALGYGDPLEDEPEIEHDEEERPESEYEAGRIRPTPPPWPFLTGIFTFPFYLTSVVRWFTLSASGAMILALAVSGTITAMQGSMASIVGVFMIAAAAIIGILWLAAAAACLLTILQETAHGVDAIENWPDAMFLDWMFQGFFLVTSTVASMMPGLAIAWALGATGLAKGALLAVSSFALFPIVLLSMLEADSPIMPWSPPILASLFRRWWTWAIFYLETALLLVVTDSLAYWVMSFGRLSVGLIMVPVEMAGIFIYFRLLGRLALCCAYDFTPPEGIEEHPSHTESEQTIPSEIDG